MTIKSLCSVNSCQLCFVFNDHKVICAVKSYNLCTVWFTPILEEAVFVRLILTQHEQSTQSF